jgi:hypothetical protein
MVLRMPADQRGHFLSHQWSEECRQVSTIFQSYGNWIGAEQYLDLIFFSNSFVPDAAIAFGVKAGTPVIDMITQTLNAYFPECTVVPNIKALLTFSAPEAGFYRDLTAFGQYVTERTQKMGAQSTGNQFYPGVFMRLRSATMQIYVYDTSKQNFNIDFKDLIGQPTWIDQATVNFKTVLRADIDVGNSITFPLDVQQPFAITAVPPAPGAAASSKTAFQGRFLVNKVHYFANFRSPIRSHGTRRLMSWRCRGPISIRWHR